MGLNGLRTPNCCIVAGINCIRPSAPFGDRAYALYPDSTWTTARTRSVRTPPRLRVLADERVVQRALLGGHEPGGLHRIGLGHAEGAGRRTVLGLV